MELKKDEFFESNSLREYLSMREINLRSSLDKLNETLVGLDFEGSAQPTKINDVFREKRKVYLEIRYYDEEIFVFEASKSKNKYVRRKLK